MDMENSKVAMIIPQGKLTDNSQKMSLVVLFCVLLAILKAQSLPHLKHLGGILYNNSFIYYTNISVGDSALKCVTDSDNCCYNSTVGGWRDESGRPVYQGVDGTTCLYVTRGDGVISLHRKGNCSDHTSGLWRCDIPDSSGEMQSLYIYISSDSVSGIIIDDSLISTQNY